MYGALLFPPCVIGLSISTHIYDFLIVSTQNSTRETFEKANKDRLQRHRLYLNTQGQLVGVRNLKINIRMCYRCTFCTVLLKWFEFAFRWKDCLLSSVRPATPFQSQETRAHSPEAPNFVRMPNKATHHTTPSLDRCEPITRWRWRAPFTLGRQSPAHVAPMSVPLA